MHSVKEELRMLWSGRFSVSRKPISLGVDLSSTAVKLVELLSVGQTYRVQKVGRVMLASDVMFGTEVLSSQGLADGLRQLLLEQGYWPPARRMFDVVIAVPDACTIRKHITVSDRLDDRDLEELVHIELEKFMPNKEGKREDVCFDFKRLVSTASQGTLKEVLIVAARTQHIQQRVSAFRLLGIGVRVVDVESHAMQRALAWILSHLNQVGITVLLDLGAYFLKILFYQDNVLLFMREETFACHPVETLGVFDITYGNALLLHIKRAYHFFYSAFPQKEPILRMVLAGGGAKQSEILYFLSQQLNISIEIANPFVRMDMTTDGQHEQLNQEAPLYMTACGLAQRAC
jgi:type IV pilus assembly protein PilM